MGRVGSPHTAPKKTIPNQAPHFLQAPLCFLSQHWSVRTVTRLEDGHSALRFPTLVRDFSRLQNIHTSSGCPPDVPLNGKNRGSFLRGKPAGAWDWFFQCTTEVTIEWSYVSSTPIAFMAYTVTQICLCECYTFCTIRDMEKCALWTAVQSTFFCISLHNTVQKAFRQLTASVFLFIILSRKLSVSLLLLYFSS